MIIHKKNYYYYKVILDVIIQQGDRIHIHTRDNNNNVVTNSPRLIDVITFNSVRSSFYRKERKLVKNEPGY